MFSFPDAAFRKGLRVLDQRAQVGFGPGLEQRQINAPGIQICLQFLRRTLQELSAQFLGKAVVVPQIAVELQPL